METVNGPIASIDFRLAGLRALPDGWLYGDGVSITEAALAVARRHAIDSHELSSARSYTPRMFPRLDGGVIVELPAAQIVVAPDGSDYDVPIDDCEPPTTLFECIGHGCANSAETRGPITAADTYLDGDVRRCAACSREVDVRPEYVPLTFTWVCAMVHVNDREPNGDGSVDVDFGGAGTFEALAEGLRDNHGDVWDCSYRYACLTRIIGGVYPGGAMPEAERWFRLDCPGAYGDERMVAVECERPVDLPPRFAWALHAIGRHVEAGPCEEYVVPYADAVRHRDGWLRRRVKRRGEENEGDR